LEPTTGPANLQWSIVAISPPASVIAALRDTSTPGTAMVCRLHPGRKEAVDRRDDLGIYVETARPFPRGRVRVEPKPLTNPKAEQSPHGEDSVDRPSIIETKRRYIQQRAQQLLERVDHMDDEELRWIVRVFADCLAPEQRQAFLGAYSEHWPAEERRRFVPSFMQRYTRVALDALERAGAGREGSLAALTDEDLQSMSMAEKWLPLADEPDGLSSDQLRRELARLFMCKSYDLFHDAGLSEAAVEYPAYYQVREALEACPAASIAELVELVVQSAARLRSRTPQDVEVALGQIRQAISQCLGIVIPPDQLFAGQMVRLPLDHSDQPPEPAVAEAVRALGDLPEVDLPTALLIVADLMTQQEVEKHLLPLQRKYRSIAEVPGEELQTLVARLWARLGDRRLTDFAERYRSGRMIAERKVAPEVWNLLPRDEQLTILERDNRSMDLGQTARHLAKILFSFQYDMLFDVSFHVALLRSPRYHQLIRRLAGPGAGPETPRLEALTRTVTRQMHGLEALAPEARRVGLQEIRAVIAAALDIPDDLTYPAGKEGRA
jgi:hypothetical protein